MRRLMESLHADLFGDDLFPRVIICMFGLIIGTIVVAALVSGVAVEVKDSSFHILLGLMATLGLAAVYAAIWGGEKLLNHMAVWAGGEVMLVLGLVTLAAPITIIIKRVRQA
jgi:hypothetical protein